MGIYFTPRAAVVELLEGGCIYVRFLEDDQRKRGDGSHPRIENVSGCSLCFWPVHFKSRRLFWVVFQTLLVPEVPNRR